MPLKLMTTEIPSVLYLEWGAYLTHIKGIGDSPTSSWLAGITPVVGAPTLPDDTGDRIYWQQKREIYGNGTARRA